MPGKFKLDENVPADAAQLFAVAGHDVETVLSEDLGGEPDRKVIDIARAEDRILVTLDLDFADTREYSPNEYLQEEEQGQRHFWLRLIQDVRRQEKRMRIVNIARSGFALALLCPIVEAQDTERSIEILRETISDSISDAERIQTNGFTIDAMLAEELGRDLEPNGTEFEMISVRANDMFQVAVEKGRTGMSLGGGIGIFHRESGVPMMSFGDRDGDGRIDILDYDVLDESGERILSITDYELDGQPDRRVHWKESYFEIWHDGQWYRVDEQNQRRGIVIDGEFTELRQEDNRWIVP